MREGHLKAYSSGCIKMVIILVCVIGETYFLCEKIVEGKNTSSQPYYVLKLLANYQRFIYGRGDSLFLLETHLEI